MLRADGPPLDPSAAHAHELLSHELSKVPYHEHSASPLRRALDWVIEHLYHLVTGSSGDLPPILTVVIVLVVAAIIVFTVPRLRRATRKRKGADTSGGGVLQGEPATAEELRRRARAALDEGRHRDALTDFYRAIARAGEERALLQIGPGSTAHEIAVQLQSLFPAEGPALKSAATAFDRVCYGGGSTDRSGAEMVADLDGRLLHQRPTQPDRLVAP